MTRFALNACQMSLISLVVIACTAQPSDTSAAATPTLYGAKPLSSIVNPAAEGHGTFLNKIVSVTGTAIVAIDSFDETENGKARGSIYVQQVGSTGPYSGIALFSPAFSPADTRPALGDVFDWSGIYRESDRIGTGIFRVVGGVQPLLIQLEKPTGKLRFDSPGAPPPRDINASDLIRYETARPWLGMLVRVKNVTIAAGTTGASGRQTPTFNSSGDSSQAAAILANELMPFDQNTFQAGTEFSSIVGVVTYAFDVHLAPRSVADLQVAPSAQAE